MNYVIENEHLKVEVADLGAELQSIYGKKTNFEYLWQGDKTYWGGRAYNLFPICGRLTEGKYTFKEKTYEMILHGFARKTVFSLIEQTKNTLVFGIKSDEKTLAIYPFEFDFKVKYYLKGASIKTEYQVTNTGKENLLFSVGGHPGFNTPLLEGADFSDHYVELPKAKKNVEKLVLSETCFYTGKNQPFKLRNGKILDLTHGFFDHDGVFLENMGNTAILKCNNGERFVKLKYSDMTHLGFWHAPKTEAPYVCIEPWHGIPADDQVIDKFEEKRELMTLKKGKKYTSYINITVNE